MGVFAMGAAAGWYPDPSGGPGQKYWDGVMWHDAVPAQPGVPTASKPKRRLSTRALLVAAAAFAFLFVVGNIVESRKDDTEKSATASSATTNNMIPTSTTTRTVRPAPKPKVSVEELDQASYRPVTEREFAYIIKDPYAHYGERIVIYGKVSQFDTLTGDSILRADVVAVPGGQRENAFIEADDPTILADVVEGDSLVMFVEVAGTDTYSTQLGGERTVPLFAAYIVQHWKR